MTQTWRERLDAKSAKLKASRRSFPKAHKRESRTVGPEPTPEPPLDIKEKYKKLLLAKRRIQRECWIWTGPLRKGYGVIWVPEVKANVGVHVLSLVIYKTKDFDTKKQVNHHCDVRNCFNPDHIYSGTHKDNMRDYHTRKRTINNIFSSFRLEL